MHHRLSPVDHRFTQPVTYVWLDPDRPGDLVAAHPLWSERRPAPVWFRRRDYLDGADRPLGEAVRELAVAGTGRPAAGPIRMLTQLRTWGWLFNPITVYLLWGEDTPGAAPITAVLEVTNTPWKERHHYTVALTDAPPDRDAPTAVTPPPPPTADDYGRGGPAPGTDALLRGPATGPDALPEPATGPGPGDDPVATGTVGARFGKSLHVSPFLDGDLDYDLRLTEPTGDRGLLVVDLDVVPTGGAADGRSPVLRTRLSLQRSAPDRATLSAALTRNVMPTHRVSLGIHRNAARLWRRGVPFVPHPDRRAEAGRAGR